jgi:hypothetical protein
MRAQKVFDELACCDVGESGVSVLEGVEVELIDGVDKLLLQGCIHIVVLLPES